MAIIREANEQLQRNVHQFMRTVRALSDDQFTEPMDGWSPRDVTAHLIGWNRASIDSANAFERGELPPVLADPGEDFADVNAAFVEKHDSADMNGLLRELELSYQELARHLYTIDEAAWTRPVRAPRWDASVTLESYIHEVSDDYAHHAQELMSWLKARALA